MNTIAIHAEPASKMLDEVIERFQPKRVAVFCVKDFFATIGAEAWLMPKLAGRQVTVVDIAFSNPCSDEVERLRREVLTQPVDLFIAVGGGSVIDMMKLMQIFQELPRETTVDAYLKAPFLPAEKPAPSVAIPTTAGTGSEATPFAVLYHNQVKYSLDYPALQPTVALLVPEFLASLPSSVRAPSALDALSQAIESYWNVHSTDASKRLSQEAIETILPVIVPFVKKTCGADPTIDAAMQWGACLAGQAIAQTRTTAPHAVSYPMTSHFRIPHGTAVALTLAEFWAFNTKVTPDDCNDRRGVDYVRQTMRELGDFLGLNDDPDAPLSIKTFWREMLADLGISYRLTDHGITTAADIEKIVAGGFSPQRVKNNPRNITENQLRDMLRSITAVRRAD